MSFNVKSAWTNPLRKNATFKLWSRLLVWGGKKQLFNYNSIQNPDRLGYIDVATYIGLQKSLKKLWILKKKKKIFFLI